jgi:hypothetical protein
MGDGRSYLSPGASQPVVRGTMRMSTRVSRFFATFFALALLVSGARLTVLAQQNAPPPIDPQAVLPIDPAIRTGTLPNGLKYFIRRNGRPEKRVSLRLAVKSGSLEETDDQQGLAHFIEHMAFNGSTHFKPGELVSYFERVGARLGPHVNAYTSFDETVYMLDLPTDQGDVVAKGLTALSDFAGGLTLDPVEIEAVLARARAFATNRSRSSSTTPGTPTVCRSASPTSSGTLRPHGCGRSTTPGTGPIAWRLSPSATSIHALSRTRSPRRSARCARARPARRSPKAQ